MINLNNYIQEKLYIDKNYKIKTFSGWDEFSDYLSKNGVLVKNSTNTHSFVCANNIHYCPFMNVLKGKNMFYIENQSDTKNGVVIVCMDNGSMKRKELNASDYGFDIKEESQYMYGYLYTKNNADILIKILDDVTKK